MNSHEWFCMGITEYVYPSIQKQPLLVYPPWLFQANANFVFTTIEGSSHWTISKSTLCTWCFSALTFSVQKQEALRVHYLCTNHLLPIENNWKKMHKVWRLSLTTSALDCKLTPLNSCELPVNSAQTCCWTRLTFLSISWQDADITSHAKSPLHLLLVPSFFPSCEFPSIDWHQVALFWVWDRGCKSFNESSQSWVWCISVIENMKRKALDIEGLIGHSEMSQLWNEKCILNNGFAQDRRIRKQLSLSTAQADG